MPDRAAHPCGRKLRLTTPEAPCSRTVSARPGTSRRCTTATIRGGIADDSGERQADWARHGGITRSRWSQKESLVGIASRSVGVPELVGLLQ